MELMKYRRTLSALLVVGLGGLGLSGCGRDLGLGSEITSCTEDIDSGVTTNHRELAGILALAQQHPEIKDPTADQGGLYVTNDMVDEVGEIACLTGDKSLHLTKAGDVFVHEVVDKLEL